MLSKMVENQAYLEVREQLFRELDVDVEGLAQRHQSGCQDPQVGIRIINQGGCGYAIAECGTCHANSATVGVHFGNAGQTLVGMRGVLDYAELRDYKILNRGWGYKVEEGEVVE